MSKDFDPDKYLQDTSAEFDPDQYLAETDEVTQAEAAGLGAAQGLTFDFADEIAGAVGGAWEYMTDEEQKSVWDAYRKNRDAVREKIKKAADKYPVTYYGSDIAAGIVPALFTGGASAAASVGKGLAKGAAKGALKTGAKQAAKTGAKVGAGVGLGASEADITKGEVGQAAQDVAMGGVLGAALGVGLPIAAEGAGRIAKSVGEDISKGIKALVPDSELAEAAYAYGKKGKKIDIDTVDDDLMQAGKDFYDRLVKAKEKNDLSLVKKELDEFGPVLNAKEAVDNYIDDVEEILRKETLSTSDRKILKKIKDASGRTAEESDSAFDKFINEKMSIQQLKKGNLEKEADIKAEKALAKFQEESNLDMLSQDELLKYIDDLEGSVITKEGQLSGKQGTFEDVDGNIFGKKVLSDTTEYQPVLKAKGRLDSGKPVAVIEDLGSGKLEVIVGKAEKTIAKDLENMTVSEVEAMRRQINQLIEESTKAGKSSNDPAIVRLQRLAVDLRDLTDVFTAKIDDGSLINKRTRISDLLTAEDLLGIKGKFKGRSDMSDWRKQKEIADKFGYKKGFGIRQEKKLAEKLVGDEVMTPEIKEQFDMLQKLNIILGRETQENISKAGLYKKAMGEIPNMAGRVNNFVANSKIAKGINSVTSLPEKTLINIKEKMLSNPMVTVQALGHKLDDALQKDATGRGRALFALGQVPAFRKWVKSHITSMDEQEREVLGLGDYMTDETGREPQSEGPAYNLAEDNINPNQTVMQHDEEEEEPLSVEDVYRNLSDKFGIPKEDIAKIGGVESLHNTLKKSPSSSARGLFQFTEDTEKRFRKRLEDKGIDVGDDIYDLKTQQQLMEAFLEENINAQKKITGKEQADIEDIYGLHNLGQTAYTKFMAALAQDPEADVDEILSDKVIKGNPAFYKDKTIQEAYDAWADKLDSKKKFEFTEENVKKVEKIKDNIIREKMDIASGGTGYERVTIDDLLGSIYDLELDDDMELAMTKAAYEGDMPELERLVENLIG